jgi:23S rRNA (adenine2503-C2)-methyltransferase
LKTSILSLEEQDKLKNSAFFDNRFRLKQILEFIYSKKIFDFQGMTNLPSKLRNNLEANFSIINIKEHDKKVSKDGTIKFLFHLEDDNYIESVLLKDINGRYTFCISTQVGCKMNCSFCMTAKMGFIRNLHYTEIISQILLLSKIANKSFNIVFMGMGEPLDNFDNLSKTISVLISKSGFKMSPSRITVSHCGILKEIINLLELFPEINIACSLNSAIQSKREKIMPIAKKYKLSELIKTLDEAIHRYKKRITLEYVLIKNFNSGREDIKKLNELIKNKKNYLINIIPYNNNEKTDEKIITLFMKELSSSGFNVTRRYRRGGDIQADCGQLYTDILIKKTKQI